MSIEFWFGKDGRLHERYCYDRVNIEANEWRRYFKSP